jgi:hypothetical protein
MTRRGSRSRSIGVLEEYNAVLEPLAANALLASPRAFAAAGRAGREVELGHRAFAASGS